MSRLRLKRRGRRGAGMNPVLAGVIVIVIAAIAVYFGFTKSIPFRHHFTIKAAFASANNIAKNSPVRIAGVNVGKVTGISHPDAGSPGGIVTMTIDNQGLPIHTDATFKIRPRIFLEGNFFVDVTPGSPSAPDLRDGGTIPVAQTADPVQLDQVLSILPTATRSQLQVLLGSLSTGLSGRGAADFNLSLPYQATAYKDNSIVNNALLGQDQHDLSGYIKSAGAVAEASAANPVALQNLIVDFNTTAGALAAKDTQLAEAIHELPQTLSVGIPALKAVNDALPNLNTFAQDFDPGVKSSLPAIKASTPLVQQLRYLVSPSELQGLVHDLRPTVPALVKLNIASVPLLQQTRAASSCQNTVIEPWSHMTLNDPNFPATGQVYQEAVKYLPGLGGESRSGDANGRWFRVLAVAPTFATPAGNNSFLFTSQQVEGYDPPHPSARPVLQPDVPCETQQVPSLATAIAPAPSGQTRITPAPTAANRAVLAAAQTDMVRLASRMVDASGLKGYLRVSSTPLNPSMIPRLKSMGGFLK